jgi:hypothetical protein
MRVAHKIGPFSSSEWVEAPARLVKDNSPWRVISSREFYTSIAAVSRDHVLTEHWLAQPLMTTVVLFTALSAMVALFAWKFGSLAARRLADRERPRRTAEDVIPQIRGNTVAASLLCAAVMQAMPKLALLGLTVGGSPVVRGVVNASVSQIAGQHAQRECHRRPTLSQQKCGQKNQGGDQRAAQDCRSTDERQRPRMMLGMQPGKRAQSVQHEPTECVLDN